jgi:hypothetical protein
MGGKRIDEFTETDMALLIVGLISPDVGYGYGHGYGNDHRET